MEAKIKATLGEELQQACTDGDLDAIEALINRHKAADTSYLPPWPAMMYESASRDRANIVEYCLDNGGLVTNDVMRLILINRAKETYILLLDRKAVDVDYYVSWFGDILGNAATRDDHEWTKLCLSRGADPNKNLANDEHMSVLAAVAELASLESAKLLVEGGASVKGSGAIVMAAQEGKLNMVKFFLDKGADIDEIGIAHPQDPRFEEDMGTALHRAVGGGNEDVVHFLIDNGADLNRKDPKGRKPLDLARAKQNAGLIEILKQHGAS